MAGATRYYLPVAVMTLCVAAGFGPAAEAAADPLGGIEAIGGNALAIRIMDYAGVRPETLAGAHEVVARIYGAIGVAVAWDVNAAPDAPTPGCSGCLEVTVRILGPRGSRLGTRGNVLGIATGTSTRGSRVVYVFYDRLELVAGDFRLDPASILGHVVAHEIGHVLLPPASHAHDGLMRGKWSGADMRGSEHQLVRFSADQADAIRRHLSAGENFAVRR
jgi:hypothetical protein